MRCITIINYTIKDHPEHGDQPIFCVTHLSDKAFSNGFRVLNPEFNVLPNKIETDTEDLKQLLEEMDETYDEPFFKPTYNNSFKSPDRRRS